MIEVLIADNKKIASFRGNDSSNISVTSKNDEQCGSFNNNVVADSLNNWSTVRNKRSSHFKHSISKENDLLLNNRFNALVDDKIKDHHITNDCGSKIIAETATSITESVPKMKDKTICILGDSIIKHIQPFKMRLAVLNKNKNKFNFKVKSFSGATTADMEDYVSPSLKSNPDVVLVHVGTNNLRSNTNPEQIADDIVSLACRIKLCTKKVIVSSLIHRNDNLNKKAIEVNNLLINKCLANGVSFCNNANINAQNLNRDGIHPNIAGTIRLADNFLNIFDGGER